MKREENMKFWRIILLKKKKVQHPPPPRHFFTTPPPRIFFLHQFFCLNVGNSMKRLENMKFWKQKFKILFF